MNKSLPNLVDDFADTRPDAAALTFIGPDGRESGRFSYRQLAARVWAVTARLEAEGLRGARVLVMAASERDFSLAFLACLHAGAIAVPLPLPEAARLVRYAPRLRAIVADAQPAAVVATSAERRLIAGIATAAGLDGLRWISIDDETDAGLIAPRGRAPGLDDVAWLQYTSGSTSAPKGVVVTHGNLVATERMIAQVHGSEGPSLSWLPLSHDMGLVGGLLQPLYCGVEAILMSPFTFLRRPARWLQLISERRVRGAAAPSFGYDYCVRRVRDADLTGVDLSCWDVAFNGAEPVRAEVLQRFAARFAPHGFRASAFFPCYGLAEATLLVAGGRRERRAPRALRLSTAALQRGVAEVRGQSLASDEGVTRAGQEALVVSCGQVAPGVTVRIVDPQSAAIVDAGRIGEIWVAGPNVARGYWRMEEESVRTFAAHVEPSGEGPFLRTGDLGFVADGELFVTGRIKDLIIVDGRNHYPQDIEGTVERCSPLFTAGGVAAFGTDREGVEELTVAVEVEGALADAQQATLLAALREAVALEHGVFPRRVVFLKRGGLPKTTSGKLQRRATAAALDAGELPIIADHRSGSPGEDPARRQGDAGSPGVRDYAALVRWLTAQIADALQISGDDVDIHAPLASLGLASRSAVELAAALERELGRELPPILAWQYPTVHALACHLAGSEGGDVAAPAPAPTRDVVTAPSDEKIAIVGMACRFPGSARDLESFWRLLLAGEEAVGPLPLDRWRRLGLPAVDLDAAGIYSRRMGTVDDIDQLDAAFFGITPREVQTMDPQQRLLLQVSWQAIEDAGIRLDRGQAAPGGVFVGIGTDDMARLLEGGYPIESVDPHAGTGAAFSTAAGRISHALNLRGPCLAVDTACSSSLMAVHLAAQSLRRGECRFALAGGVNVVLSPKGTAYLCRLHALSAAGRCRTFDAAADGYVRAEGCGVVVMKRLSDALAAGDRIWAVLSGSASNHDGTSNGLTAPNQQAQQEVIRDALQAAGHAARDVAYVECHGTGTPLGDPIEARALGAALAADRARPLLIGSVKTNLGHLEAAAGIAGVIKVALSLHHRRLPAHLHVDVPNPHIPWAELALEVPRQTVDWTGGGEALVAGVSAFGLSGTNVHALLTSAPATPDLARSDAERGPPVLCLSARSEGVLRTLAGRYAQQIRTQDHSLAALAGTANQTRARFEHRAAIVSSSRDEVVEALEQLRDAMPSKATVTRGRARTSGAVAFLFTGQGDPYPGMGRGLYQLEPTFRAIVDRLDQVLRRERGRSLRGLILGEPADHLDVAEWAQPILYAVSAGLAALWRSWGVRPAIVFGHGAGELAAAQVAGVFGLEDGMRLAIARGDLARSEARGSSDAAAALARLEEVAATVPLALPRLDLLSSETGNLVAAEIAAAGYWSRSQRAAAPLDRALAHLKRRNLAATIEIGLGLVPATSTPADDAMEVAVEPATGAARVCACWRRGHDEATTLRRAVAALFCAGVDVDLAAVSGGISKRVPLPAYPLEMTSHPISISYVSSEAPSEPAASTFPISGTAATADPLQAAFHRVDWIEGGISNSEADDDDDASAGRWLLFARAGDVRAAALATALGRRGCDVGIHEVEPGWPPADGLSAHLAAETARDVRGVVWMVDAAPSAEAERDLRAPFDAACFGLLRLAAWLAARPHGAGAPRLWIATQGALALDGDQQIVRPLSTALWGLARGLAHEMGRFRVATVDRDEAATADPRGLVDVLLGNGPEDRIALRGERVLVARLVTIEPAPPPAQPAPVEPDAAYLVTGGLGALGLETARWLVANGAGRVVLASRRPPSPQAAAVISELAAGGAVIDVVACDVADTAALAGVLETIRGAGLPLKGVVHAAGALEADGLGAVAVDGSFDRLYEGVRAKVMGARNLDRLTTQDPLSFFVLYGSAASILGAPAHAVYSAGNAFLDGIARARRMRGLPALSIAWGPFGDVGMAARHGPDERSGFGGLAPMKAHQGIAALGRLLSPEIDAGPDASLGLFLPTDRLAELAALAAPFFQRWRVAQPGTVAGTTADAPWRLLLAGRGADDRRALLAQRLAALIQEVLGLPAAPPLDPEVGLSDLGMDSLMALEIGARVRAGLGITLPTTLMFDRPNLDSLTTHILDLIDKTERPAPTAAAGPGARRARAEEPIAIIGSACRFPGQADDPDSFWQLLHEARSAVSEVPASRWDVDEFFDPTGKDPRRTYARWGAFLREVDRFDADFFRISPREAAATDPQQRLLLEVAWEALENAGCAPADLRESQTGVFVGIGIGDYATLRSRARDADLDPYVGTGTAFAFSAGRLSYCLGLRGPSLAVDTACSSSLVAIHLACQSLRRGETRAALAGGVHLMLSPYTFVYLSRIEALSRTGKCRTFDAGADGYVRGEGCGVFVLKRLGDALADGDRISAVIRGSAVNHDGPSGGLTVPSGAAQEAVVRAALDDANVAASQVDYVECHGTGTALGDPIEVRALGAVMKEGRKRPLYIGSVKTNVGHLEAASGMAGLMKVVLAMQHREIPAHLNFERPSEHIPWAELPIEVPRARLPWNSERRRIAGVSAFGLSGTNAHVIVEEAPAPASEATAPRAAGAPAPGSSPFVLCLSARTESALRELGKRFVPRLEAADPSDVEAICDLSLRGRNRFEYRAALIGRSGSELAAHASAFAGPSVIRGRVRGHARGACFLFTGQGAQYPGMGKGIYDAEPAFRSVLDACDALTRELRGESLLTVMFDGPAEQLAQTTWTQPALYALEIGLVALWRSWGIQPRVVLGHSVGELAAAHAAGVMSAEEGLVLALARGAAIQSSGGTGAMLAVRATQSRIMSALHDAALEGAVEIAANNTAEQTVLTGPSEAIDQAQAVLTGAGIQTNRLKVSHAFHSRLMEPALAPFAAALARVALQPPRIALVSNVTGELIGPEAATPGYWTEQLRRPVRFEQGLRTAAKQAVGVFVELGPRPVLSALALEVLGGSSFRFIPSLRMGEDDRVQIATAAAELFVNGLAPQRPVAVAGARPVVLPNYPFERKRFWFEDGDGAAATEASRPARDAQRLPGVELRSAGRERIFETRWLTTGAPAPLTKVGDIAVVGLEIWLDAWIDAWANTREETAGRGDGDGDGSVALHAITLRQFVAVNPGEETVAQIVLGPADPSGSRDALVASRMVEGTDPAGPDVAPWVAAVEATLARPAVDTMIDAPGSRASMVLPDGATSTGGLRLYDDLEKSGWTRAVAQRVLADVQASADGAVATLSPSDGSQIRTGRQEVLGAALDLLCWLGTTRDDRGALHLPERIEALRWTDAPPATRAGAPLVLVARRSAEATDTNAGATWDVEIRDPGGATIGRMVAVRMRPFAGALDTRMPAPPLPTQEIIWQAVREVPAAAARPSSTAASSGWLLLGDPSPFVTDLGVALAARGQRVETIGLDDAADARLAALARAAANGEIRGWVHLGPVAQSPAGGDDPLAALRAPVEPLLRWLSALCAARASVPGWVVTQGAEAVGGDVVTPCAAASSALVRVAANELGGRSLVSMDLALDCDLRVAAAALADRMLAPPAPVARLALRNGEWLQPRLRTVKSRPRTPRFRGAHLVTGGLGSIGFALGRWLLAHGAEHLVLLGRSAPRPEQAVLLDAARARGTRVTTIAGDVADPRVVERALSAIEEARRPLRGVYHAAGVLDDGPLESQTWDRFAAVLRAKVAGAENLDRLTTGSDLDFFVLFSSVAAALGTQGQASYAAANAYLDALATRRRHQGRKALSIAWGPWMGDGMAGRTRTEDRWRAIGIEPIAPPAAFAHLGRLLFLDAVATPLVLPLRDARVLRALMPSTSLLDTGDDTPEAAANQGEGHLRRKLADTAPAARESVMIDFLVDEIEALLGQPGTRRLDPDHPLSELGFDSLMAVKLIGTVQTALAIALSATTSFDHPTPAALARYLLSRIDWTEGAGTPPVGAEDPAHERRTTPEEQPAATVTPPVDVDALSDDELLRFIDQKTDVDESSPERGQT